MPVRGSRCLGSTFRTTRLQLPSRCRRASHPRQRRRAALRRSQLRRGAGDQCHPQPRPRPLPQGDPGNRADRRPGAAISRSTPIETEAERELFLDWVLTAETYGPPQFWRDMFAAGRLYRRLLLDHHRGRSGMGDRRGAEAMTGKTICGSGRRRIFRDSHLEISARSRRSGEGHRASAAIPPKAERSPSASATGIAATPTMPITSLRARPADGAARPRAARR